jgi:very-short-patch-repair endonuclease
MDDKGDNRPDAAIARLAAEQWAVLSTEELRRCGLSREMIAARARRGFLHRLHRGVYAVGHPNVPVEGAFLAAVKACGDGAVLSHFSAAALWGMVDWDERTPEVTVCDTTWRKHPGVRVHRTQILEARDWRHRNGIPVTAPARTALDLAAQLRFVDARRAIRQALSDRFLTMRDLIEIVGRQSARPGARALRRIIAAAPAPTRSLLEDLVLDVIRVAGLERPDVNVPIVIDGRRVIPDFRWPSRRLVVEADGRRWHDNQLAREDDAERQALLEAHGERVIRINWEQAIRRRAETVARLRAAAGIH